MKLNWITLNEIKLNRMKVNGVKLNEMNQKQHVDGGNVADEKSCLYHRFWGSKALFDYINLQLNQTIQNFSFEEITPYPLQSRA